MPVNAWLCEHTDKPHEANGLCRACYARNRYRATHPNFVPADTPLIDRFMSHVTEDPETGCFLWTGAHKSEAQGSYPMYKSRHAVAVHYEVMNPGKHAPRRGEGVELSHTCVTGSRCANSAHTVIEDHKANMLRRGRKALNKTAAYMRAHLTPESYAKIGKARRKTHCKYGHPRTASNLDGTQCRTCKKRLRREREALTGWLRAVTGGKPYLAHGKQTRESGVTHILTRTVAPIYTNHL
jgi:hypothetical protein